MNYASAGIGAASHLAAERFRIAAGITGQHVPFRGPTEALTEVMAGRIDFYFLPVAPALPLIKEGKLVALAVSTGKRAAALPDVPTTAEIGLKDAAYHFWTGLFAPVKTPHDIIAKLHDETQKAVQLGAVQERLAKLGVEPLTMSPAEFERYFKEDVASTVKLAEAAGIQKQYPDRRASTRKQGRPAMAAQPVTRTPAPSAPVQANTFSTSPRSTTFSAGRTIPPPTAPASKAIG